MPPIYYIQISHRTTKHHKSAPSSPIKLLLIISRRISETVDDTALPLRGSGKVVARYIGIVVVVVAVPLRSFAFSLTLWVRLLTGSAAADGFWLLAGWWWSKMVICCRSWDSGCWGKM